MSASPSPAPIACSLDMNSLRDRIAWIRSFYAQSLRGHQLVGNTLSLTFEGNARAKVDELVGKERECCAFLTFTVEQDADQVRLIIDAPDVERVDALLSPFMPEETQAKAAAAPACACCG